MHFFNLFDFFNEQIFFQKYFSAAKRQNNIVEYLMQTKKNTFEIVSSAEAKQFWPTLTANFLEKCVVWQMPSSRIDRIDYVEVEAKENINPIRILCKVIFKFIYNTVQKFLQT